MRAPAPAGVCTASRGPSAPRKNAVTGTSSASASPASVVRLHEICAFSIFESVAFEMPARAATSATVAPPRRRSSRTRTAIACSSQPRASAGPAISRAAGPGGTSGTSLAGRAIRRP